MEQVKKTRVARLVHTGFASGAPSFPLMLFSYFTDDVKCVLAQIPYPLI